MSKSDISLDIFPRLSNTTNLLTLNLQLNEQNNKYVTGPYTDQNQPKAYGYGDVVEVVSQFSG